VGSGGLKMGGMGMGEGETMVAGEVGWKVDARLRPASRLPSSSDPLRYRPLWRSVCEWVASPHCAVLALSGSGRNRRGQEVWSSPSRLRSACSVTSFWICVRAGIHPGLFPVRQVGGGVLLFVLVHSLEGLPSGDLGIGSMGERAIRIRHTLERWDIRDERAQMSGSSNSTSRLVGMGSLSQRQPGQV
jgi:hypothetical protein